ncbi:MAG: class I SAM-dependent methyltransferase [Gemmatimonadales bacterium]
MTFKDLFSGGAAGYASFRPHYPAELFAWLAETSPRHDLAWDCATGNGQAAIGLAAHFDRVIATDASSGQLREAQPHPRVEYREARAEACELADRSVDLVTVAQALHWLDLAAFYAEARRVARPGALLACWMYNLPRLRGPVDAIVDRLYRDVVGPYWMPDRVHVDRNYQSLDFPEPRVEAPEFVMVDRWNVAHFLGYLRTWSAATRYLAVLGRDPVALVEAELRAAWSDGPEVREIRWPLVVRAARLE